MKSRRRGKFHIADQTINEDPELVRQILSRVIVVRAEQLWHMDAIEYFAICDEWREIEQGEETPAYVCLIERTRAGNLVWRGWNEATKRP